MSSFSDTIRERMLNIYQTDNLRYEAIARKAGLSPSTVCRFLTRNPAYQTDTIAQAIARAFPQAAGGLICPSCGKLMCRDD